MKKVFALLLAVVLCLLLCGCQSGAEADDKDEGGSGKSWVTLPAGLQTEPAETEPAETEPAETEPAPTEPSEDEMVTVYLLESAQIFDSGRMEYIYDDNDNILSINIYTIEDDLRYTVYFDECDLEGLPGGYHIQWPEGGGDQYKLTYTDGARITDIQYVGGNFTGTQFAYDNQGRLIEERSYYEGVLENGTYYQYAKDDNGRLVNAYGEDAGGNLIFECLVEDGRITEYKYIAEESYSRLCEYDENGNLASDAYIYDGETTPGTFYKYRAVTVDARRAMYLVCQQKLAMWAS